MKYGKDRYGNLISRLGYGCMRFTKKGPSIDYEKAKKEVLLAIENGVNYFDTAYIYSGSEVCLGRILEESGLREKVYIATKLPQYMTKTRKKIEKTFAEELERLRTGYIDYYLMHMFTDISEWERLKTLGIEEWIDSRKADGSIKNIGFSYHGGTEMFLKVLDAYDWDFCQIQYNYMDVTSQAGVEGLKAAAAKGIPVIIMEPLRGGRLVNLPQDAMEALRDSGTGYSAAELAFRWLWDQPEVTCVLSGMNSEEMIKENIRVASEADAGCLTDADRELTQRIKSIIKSREKVGCTGCGYCMPCPHGVDIPGNFYYYNLMYIEKKRRTRIEFAQNIALKKDPGYASKCVACGKCEKHCPQHIPIIEMLKKADKELRPPVYRLGTGIVRKFTGK